MTKKTREKKAFELLQQAILDWSKEIDKELPINGADAVDWLVNFIHEAKKIVSE